MNNTLIGLCTYNHYTFTYLCLKSLERNTPALFDGRARLVIIDNNSTDNTIENIQRDFPWAKDIIISFKDCITYQWNKFLDLLQENEDFLMIPNDVVFGPNWLELLQEDTYKYDNVICGSPYLPVDLQYDAIINEDWANHYNQIYQEVRNARSVEDLESHLDILYGGDFNDFCLEFQKRNQNEPPIDSCVTHVMLFKNKLFSQDKFRFSEEYCPYYGSHEFDTNARLNNLGYFRIASSRSYVHHWISISNQTASGSLSEKQRAIQRNNIRLLQKWKPLPETATYLNQPMPSRISNWRTPYYKFELRSPELSEEDAAKVPGIKFMSFEGITPGHDYFDQIQPGSILRNRFGSYSVFWRDEKYLGINWSSAEPLPGSINKESFIKEQYHIDYYWRKEEEEYFGKGHRNTLLKNWRN